MIVMVSCLFIVFGAGGKGGGATICDKHALIVSLGSRVWGSGALW